MIKTIILTLDKIADVLRILIHPRKRKKKKNKN